MLTAKAFDFEHAKFGMISTTALGNVMKQRGRVENKWLVPTGSQLRTKRVFVSVVGNEEAAHVSKDHENVLVDCVNVKQVVLHLTHNVSEHPQVAPQN